ncbi:MAG: hypothetical protein V3T72_01370, partial [Thermoanaerobaculia bacterium]
IVGVVIAVLAAFVTFDWVWILLAILGLVVGFLNVSAAESRGFLIAAIGLLMSTTALQGLPTIGELLTTILSNLAAFISPALLVVALKSLFETAKD